MTSGGDGANPLDLNLTGGAQRSALHLGLRRAGRLAAGGARFVAMLVIGMLAVWALVLLFG